AVPDNLLLLDYLREVAGLTGTKTGCDGGACGAWTVGCDDKPRLSCLPLAAAVQGCRVDTVESLARDGRLSAVQRGFHEKLGAQCGYCTPGFIMASAGLLRRNPHPSEADIREALGSNICRCTGYVKIIEAVKHAAPLHAQGVAPWSLLRLFQRKRSWMRTSSKAQADLAASESVAIAPSPLAGEGDSVMSTASKG